MRKAGAGQYLILIYITSWKSRKCVQVLHAYHLQMAESSRPDTSRNPTVRGVFDVVLRYRFSRRPSRPPPHPAQTEFRSPFEVSNAFRLRHLRTSFGHRRSNASPGDDDDDPLKLMETITKEATEMFRKFRGKFASRCIADASCDARGRERMEHYRIIIS